MNTKTQEQEIITLEELSNNFSVLDKLFKDITTMVNSMPISSLKICEDLVYKEEKQKILLEMDLLCKEFRKKHKKTILEKIKYKLKLWWKKIQ